MWLGKVLITACRTVENKVAVRCLRTDFNTNLAWLVYNLEKLTQLRPVNAIIKKKKTWLSMHENIKKLKFSPFVQVSIIITDRSNS